MKLSGSTVLVTGAGSGLGRVLALDLARKSRLVWVTDRDAASAEQVAAEITRAGGTARARALDVSDWQAWREAHEELGPVDLLVNNAGVADLGPLVDTDPQQWDRQLDINLMGVVRGCRTFVPEMVQQRKGHVLNIASMAGLAMAPGMISYNTAKAAVVAFSESLRVEVALEGVGVSVCCPAFFRTNLTDSMDGASPAMVARIQKWMDTSGVTAEDVSTACLKAIERNDFMILTHPETWKYWMMKRIMPERYRTQLIDRERKRRAKRSS